MARLGGWGRYPSMDCEVAQPASAADCARWLDGAPTLARGLGRSYGDSAIAPHVTSTRFLDRFIAFDHETGLLACEAGASLHDILCIALPRGWFLPVVPGTRFVSVGGAIASDVHGKNHHRDGAFGDHLREIRVLTGSGELVTASRGSNADLFHATCGGMGLTGVIVSATIQLQRVASASITQTMLAARNLGELLDAIDANPSARYSAAWIDCMARGARLGRGVLILGDHAAHGALEPPPEPAWRVPFDMPAATLNSVTVRAFNTLYWHRQRAMRPTRTVAASKFFFPLDALHDWNRLYGRAGPLQYQCVLPDAAARPGLREMLARIEQSRLTSFLGVLKRFGPANRNMLSFPTAGYTLALDFKVDDGSLRLMDSLDELVTAHGGRIYLAKDARMSPHTFRRCYPRWEEFESVRARWQAHGRFASAQSRRLGLA